MKNQGIIFLLLSGLSLICLLVLRFLLGGWVNYLWVPLVFFLVFLVAALWNYRTISMEFFSLKTTKEGMSMGTMIALVLALLVAVNYLGAKKYKTFDFSASQVNTLSDQSKMLLAGLSEELKIIFFYKKGTEGIEENRRAFLDLVQKYQDQSPKVKLEFVEVNENPKLAQEYGVNKGSGLVFLEYKGRRNKIEKIDEQELTGALVKVTREKDKKVFFTIGHGERDWEDAQEASGLNAFKKLLEGNRYLVSPLNLNQAPEVPTDADLLIVAGPEQSFQEREVQALERYLTRGGSLVLAVKGKADHGLNPLFNKMGVKVPGTLVVQVMETALGKAVNPQATPVTIFSSTEAITKPFGRGDFILMRIPSPLIKGKVPEGVTFEELAKTESNSMAFPDATFKGAADVGPFVTAALLKGKFPGADSKSKDFHLVLFGDVDFLSNQLLYKNLNRDLALNSVAFLAKEENVISISPKEVDVTKLQITETQFYIFVFGFIIPLPLLLIAASGFLWYRRRYA
ncbi:MAG: GldG family protein [Pseudobdellovibrionaceae bacterium]